MNYKRKKSKRSVRCTMCTAHRWLGNSRGRWKPKYDQRRKEELS